MQHVGKNYKICIRETVHWQVQLNPSSLQHFDLNTTEMTEVLNLMVETFVLADNVHGIDFHVALIRFKPSTC